MQHVNGNVESYGQIQFVNETESTLAGHPDYGGGLKRSAGDAGFDSDSEMVGHDMVSSRLTAFLHSRLCGLYDVVM